ncbi:SsgA family sporulation/cell division regulator [Streptomyces sp. TLI_171]|uniref:SsgA family sporulation/cell division regulator n=1 Tax=Streptomyces sp. TLI_171 TaxID=1938859 RepID=UPI000C19BBF6|nr:SsgA family sporulation/cell division regulator [Streptomyces sp. TLI_171]RKE17350.1 sporulation and cell division protein SsgA [Streptomyces sp. TLI_171]
MPVRTFHATVVTLPEAPYPHRRLPARLCFDAAHPYAVQLSFPPDGAGWSFERDLLERGRHEPVGAGDVVIEPAPGRQVLIRLRTPGDQLVLAVPADTVAAFLCDAYTLVPPGTESDHLDLDAALARLLD